MYSNIYKLIFDHIDDKDDIVELFGLVYNVFKKYKSGLIVSYTPQKMFKELNQSKFDKRYVEICLNKFSEYSLLTKHEISPLANTFIMTLSLIHI